MGLSGTVWTFVLFLAFFPGTILPSFLTSSKLSRKRFQYFDLVMAVLIVQGLRETMGGLCCKRRCGEMVDYVVRLEPTVSDLSTIPA